MVWRLTAWPRASVKVGEERVQFIGTEERFSAELGCCSSCRSRRREEISLIKWLLVNTHAPLWYRTVVISYTMMRHSKTRTSLKARFNSVYFSWLFFAFFLTGPFSCYFWIFIPQLCWILESDWLNGVDYSSITTYLRCNDYEGSQITG